MLNLCKDILFDGLWPLSTFQSSWLVAEDEEEANGEEEDLEEKALGLFLNISPDTS
jgi:hypothetical protein